MTATLRLIPLSKGECRTLLEKKGKIFADDISRLPACPVEECDRNRNPIKLKLCRITDDIVDVDSDIEPDTVNYASRYQDGRFAAVVSLGRNRFCGIKWEAISRALCDVSIAMKNTEKETLVDLVTNSGMENLASPYQVNDSDAKKSQQSLNCKNGSNLVVASLAMRKAAGTHAVYLDGDLVKTPIGSEIPLKHGSIISLFGRTGFVYQVQISQNEKENVPMIKSDSPKRLKVNPPINEQETSVEEKQPTARENIRQRAHKAMEAEFTCAMCFDVLVKSTFAYPCSHAFCEECSLSVTNAASAVNTSSGASKSKGMCPTCRGIVEAWMPARSYDTQAWSFALQGCFERSDAENYLERRKQAGEDAPTEEERRSILNIEEGKGLVGEKGIMKRPSKKPDVNLNKTLPPASSAANIQNANNGNYMNLADHHSPPQTCIRATENDVICISM